MGVGRKRRKKRARGVDNADDDNVEEGKEGREFVAGSSVPLMWIRIDPDLEYAMRVVWTGRQEKEWSGQPEFMCREQLEHHTDVAAQVDAA